MPIPLKTREKMNNDPLYQHCSLYGQHGHVCDGRITREHAIIIGGKKCQKEWAVIPCCASGHGVDQFQDAGTAVPKDMREWVALNRATNKDLQEACGEEMYKEISPLSKTTLYVQRRKFLNAKYGKYERQFPVDKSLRGIVGQIAPTQKFVNGRINLALDNVEKVIHPMITFPDASELKYPAASEKNKWYLISNFDQAIIDRAKAHCKATGHFVGSDQTMIAIMIREYGKELDAVEALVGGTDAKNP